MNIDINDIDPKLLEEDDRIDSYLKGKMTEEEERLFFKELEEKPEMKEKAISMARLVKGMKEVGAIQDQGIKDAFLASSKENVETAATDATGMAVDSSGLRFCIVNKRKPTDDLDSTDNEQVVAMDSNEMSSNRIIWKTIKWMSFAASIIAVIWFIGSVNHYAPKSDNAENMQKAIALAEEYCNAFPQEINTRGGGTPSEAYKKIENLFQNINENKDLDETIHDLSICWEISTQETYNDYTDYSAEIGWYLAIAHLKNNDRKNAKVVLEKLISVSEEGSAVYIKARELLIKIEIL